jgi:DNA-binding NtrC family response regulator
VYQFNPMIHSPRALPDSASPLLAGDSMSAQSLRQLLALAAGSADPVLITGPAGAGKRALAKIIHAHSPIAAYPFIETSGGSFNADHLAAHWDGIYYLSQIQSLSIPAQHQLLKWLDSAQGQTVKLIASSDGRDDGDRIIAPLRVRLHRLRVPCPALSQRRADIAIMLKRLWAADHNHIPPIFDQAAWATLANHQWPGNYRALEAFANKTARLFGGRNVSADQVRRLLGGHSEKRLDCRNFDLKQHLAQEEKLFLIESLLRSNGVVAEAAGMAGLKRTTFIAKMKRHGLARI